MPPSAGRGTTVRNSNQMTEIKLKKSFLKFYVSLFAIVIITFSLSVFCIIFGYFQLIEGVEELKDYFLIPFGIVFLIFGIFSARSYLINVIALNINNNQLVYNNQIISDDVIDNISFRTPIVFGGGVKTIGTIIHLKNGEKIKLFEEFYSNSDKFNKFINDKFINSKETIFTSGESKTYNNYLSHNSNIILKGNLVFSYRSLYLIWVPLFFIVLIIFNAPPTPPLSFIILFAIFIIGYFLLQFYFLFIVKLTDNLLIIKHYLLPYKHRFDINMINEIQFLSRPKLPNQLKITTNDFKTYSFYMGTLREKQEWLKLKDYLDNKKIKIINWGVI